MVDDIGGIVYVSKNELYLLFANGLSQTIEIDTNKLMILLESRSIDCWRTKEFEIEPMYRDEGDNTLLTVITIKFNETDDDHATVFRCDLLDTLKLIECTQTV